MGEPQAERDAFVAFLKNDLLPDARGEETHLYALVDTVLRTHGRPSATMIVDHEFIADYVTKIELTARDLVSANSIDRPRMQQRLRDLAIRLDAIVELHMVKEERIYLPLIEEHFDQARQGRGLEAIHDINQEERKMPEDRPLDVRTVTPRERHTQIFDTYNALRPGEAFILINDHDPKPLYYQFEAEHAGQFSWDYLEQGPDTWRVRIARSA
ncbi:MAG: DUF2249 domain-containing protein [Candidatus Binataceae bacterium]